MQYPVLSFYFDFQFGSPWREDSGCYWSSWKGTIHLCVGHNDAEDSLHTQGRPHTWCCISGFWQGRKCKLQLLYWHHIKLWHLMMMFIIFLDECLSHWITVHMHFQNIYQNYLSLQRLVSVGLDQNSTINVWDWRKAKIISTVRGHSDRVKKYWLPLEKIAILLLKKKKKLKITC